MKLPVFITRASFLIPAFIVVLAFGAPWLTKAYFLVTAPKFSSIHYAGTQMVYSCLLLIADSGCSRTDRYQASGHEADLARAVIQGLAKKKYELRTLLPDNSPDVSCMFGRGNEYDEYIFAPAARNDPHFVVVRFYVSSLKTKSPNVVAGELTKVGCDNHEASFRIEATRDWGLGGQ